MARQVVGKILPVEEVKIQDNLKRGVNLKPNIPNLSPGEQEGVRAELLGDDRISPDKLSPTQIFTGLKNSPEDAKTILKNTPGDPAIKRQVANLIDKSPEEAANAVVRAEADKAAGKPVGDVDNFLSALTYFLPTALSGVLGAAIGGSEAGVAAAQATQGLQAGYLDYLDKRANTQLKAAETISNIQQKQTDVDLTPNLIDTRTGSPATTRKVNGRVEAIDLNGNVIPSQFVTDKQFAIMENQNRNFQQSQSRLKDELEVKYANLQRNLVKDEELSEAQYKEISDMAVTRKSLDALNSLSKEAGVVSGRVDALIQNLGFYAGEDAAKLKTTSELVRQAYRKMISGAAVSEQEIKELSGTMPDPKTNPKQFAAKIRAINEEIGRKIETKLNTLKKAQPRKSKVVDSLVQDLIKPDEKKSNKSRLGR